MSAWNTFLPWNTSVKSTTLRKNNANTPEFLGQGTYGCVFSPPPRCEFEEEQPFDKGYIAKVFFDKSSMKEEMRIYENIVQVVDPTHKFTPRVIIKCLTDYSSIPSDQKRRCKENLEGKYQLIMENKGMDWKKFLESSIFGRKKLAVLFRNAYTVCDGVRRMHDKNFVHNDIKPANLLFDAKTNQVNLIDFGVAMQKASIYNVDNLDFHCHNYLFYPPEFSYICNIREDEIFREEFNVSRKNTPIDNFVKQHFPHDGPVENTLAFEHLSSMLASEMEPSELAEILYGFTYKPRTRHFRDFLQRWDEKYDQIREKFPKKTHATVLRDTIKQLNMKDYVDVYMIGSTFLYMFLTGLEKELHADKNLLGLKKYAKLYAGILRLIAQSIHANPQKRIPIHAFVGQYRNLLYSMGYLMPSKSSVSKSLR